MTDNISFDGGAPYFSANLSGEPCGYMPSLAVPLYGGPSCVSPETHKIKDDRLCFTFQTSAKVMRTISSLSE